ncbi:MAG: hypothetical protein PGN22_02785 [Agrobacterium cavarae]
MIYAVRGRGSRKTLIEFKSKQAFDTFVYAAFQSSETYEPVPSEVARKWVLDGKEHETGLFIDRGRVRYAPRGS